MNSKIKMSVCCKLLVRYSHLGNFTWLNPELQFCISQFTDVKIRLENDHAVVEEILNIPYDTILGPGPHPSCGDTFEEICSEVCVSLGDPEFFNKLFETVDHIHDRYIDSY